MNDKAKKPSNLWKILSIVLAIALVAVSCTWIFTAQKAPKASDPEKTSATEASSSAEADSVQTSATPSEKRKVIIDTDTGADDATGLIIAAKDPNVEILGVTVSEGNVSLKQAVDNALMTLELANCDAPVYAGADTTYTGKHRQIFSVFGTDGMGDQDLIHPTRKAAQGNAVDFIIETVKAHPDEVEILALGPVTNLAMAFDKDPDTMKRVKRYWSMGTTGFGQGNATPVAEFNVYHDAEAYKVFCESGVPVTVMGLDMMSDKVLMTKEWLDELATKGGLSEFVSKSFSGLVDFNTKANAKAVADDPDGVFMACVLWDGFVQDSQACHAVVMTKDDETYGQVVLYREGRGYDTGVKFDDYNFTVITKIADDTYKDKLAAILAQ